jgi:hypothetical protein
LNEIVCQVRGCQEVFKTEEAVSKDARYICRFHPRAHQLAAVGRFVHNSDSRDEDVHFQEFQFDKSFQSGQSKVRE